MPAVAIRMMESLAKVLAYTRSAEQRRVLLRQAEMIWRGSQAGIAEVGDLEVVRQRYEMFLAEHARLATGASAVVASSAPPTGVQIRSAPGSGLPRGSADGAGMS